MLGLHRHASWWRGGGVLIALVLMAALAGPVSAVVPTQHTVTVCAYDSTGTGLTLGNDQAWLQAGSSNHYVGQFIGYPVDSNGCRYESVNDGATVEVWVARLGTTSAHQSATITADTTFDFYTTKVTLQYSNSLAYGGAHGDSAWFSKPSMELFSNGVTPVHFRLTVPGAASGRLELTWPSATGPGATFTRSLIALRLVDSTGAPLDGGTARYKTGPWYYAPGSTGDDPLAPGILSYAIPGLVGTVSNEMKFNNTTQTVTQDASVNSVYQFQTRALTLELRTAGGDPLAGGKARYGHGASYWTWWFPGGLTDAGGQSSAQVFPGTYSFEMQYQGTAEAKISVDIPDADTTLTWNTATVTLYYSGSVSFGGSTGNARWFNKPTMNLLAGTYTFHFRDPAGAGVTVPLTWGSGETYTKSMIIVHLNGSSGGLEGGVAKYSNGSWHPIGTTDADGMTYLLENGTLGNIKVDVGYHNGSSQQTYSQPTHSIFTFGTVDATISLHEHLGGPIEGGVVDQGGGTWIPVGTTDAAGNVTFPVFPGSYKFRMTYQGGSQEMTQDISSPVVFQTGAVFSDSGTATQYATGTWLTFTQNIELLPGSSWHFKFSDGTPITYYTIVAGTVNHIH